MKKHPTRYKAKTKICSRNQTLNCTKILYNMTIDVILEAESKNYMRIEKHH